MSDSTKFQGFPPISAAHLSPEELKEIAAASGQVLVHEDSLIVNEATCEECGLRYNPKTVLIPEGPCPQCAWEATTKEDTEALKDAAIRIGLAEDARFRAELERMDMSAKLADTLQALGRLSGKERVGSTFHRQRVFPRQHELISRDRSDPIGERYIWRPSRVAYESGLSWGDWMSIDRERFRALPMKVQAESWWHLCAQVGLVEGVARICYMHPEEGQESAVAGVKGVGE